MLLGERLLFVAGWRWPNAQGTMRGEAAFVSYISMSGMCGRLRRIGSPFFLKSHDMI
jgi:hypothetical protein